MNNKKIAIIIVLFIVGFMAITALLGIAGHIPFLGKAISLILASALIIIVLLFFIISGKRK